MTYQNQNVREAKYCFKNVMNELNIFESHFFKKKTEFNLFDERFH